VAPSSSAVVFQTANPVTRVILQSSSKRKKEDESNDEGPNKNLEIESQAFNTMA